MKIVDISKDMRSGCTSILTTMKLAEYFILVNPSFEKKGNIEGQRDVIKRSASAAKIRKRMNEDFVNGAIFPQVVIGLLDLDGSTSTLKVGEEIDIKNIDYEKCSIIDGMQRTGVYFTNYETNKEREIRVEFWVTETSVKLLYRMLVLNTGQVPWNTRRQVEVIFANLSNNIIDLLYKKYPELDGKIEIISVDDKKRRTQAGKYHKSAIIEAYLGFNTRKVKVNVADELANEFQRFDMMEALEQSNSFDYFVSSLGFLCMLDFSFSECSMDIDTEVEQQEGKMQFASGKDIFTSQPACLGFMVACGEYIMGKPSTERTDEQKQIKMNKLEQQISKIIAQLKIMKETNTDYLALLSLSEIVAELSKSKIGDEMRMLFKNAFLSLIKDDDIEEISSYETFWRE